MRQTDITEYFVQIKSNLKSKSKRQIQSLITNYMKIEDINEHSSKQKKNDTKVYGYNPKTDSWHCLKCGENMGITNPRQLCGKIYCYNEIF